MRRQQNMYVITHADGHTTQVVAPNMREVTNAIRTFKIDAVQVQRVPKGDRTFKAHLV
jgi:hypothetical protein